MWPLLAVILPPLLDHDPGFAQVSKPLAIKTLGRSVPLNLSILPFCHGLPGRIVEISLCLYLARRPGELAMNCGPVSRLSTC